MIKQFAMSVAMTLVVLCGSVPVSTAQDDTAAIRDVSSGSDFRVRVAAALALGSSRNPGARPALEKALSDAHPAVRAAAAAALGRLGDPAALPALRRAAGNEATANVKTQLDATIKKLGSATAGKPKFLVALGRTDIRAGINAGAMTTASFKAASRAKMQQVAGIELVADGADVGVAAKSRGLPAFTLDGSITKLTKGQDGGGVSYSARVEYVIRKMPEQALKGMMAGTAQAAADPRERMGSQELEQLQSEALNAAVESALKNASPTLEAAIK